MLTLSCLYHYGPPQRSSVDGSHSCRWLPVSLRLRTSCGHWSRPEGPGNHCLRNGLRPWSPELDNTHSMSHAVSQRVPEGRPPLSQCQPTHSPPCPPSRLPHMLPVTTSQINASPAPLFQGPVRRGNPLRQLAGLVLVQSDLTLTVTRDRLPHRR